MRNRAVSATQDRTPFGDDNMTAAIADEFGRIPMSPFLKATLARAADYATAQMHREVTLEHLLLALAEDPEASVVLKSSQIEIQRLMADVSTYLGRNDDRVEAAAQAGGAISGDLRRILEASAAAASQGRRREINGAIVLAAIVGDGKSPAAHMLRSQGLTFEQAIRALQQAASAPSTQTAGPQTVGGRPQSTGAPPAPRAATTDDIMASARERVMTRTGLPEPSLERTQPPARPVEVAPPPPNPAELSIPRPPIDNGAVDTKASNANVDAIARRMGESGVQSRVETRFEPDLPSPQSHPALANPALAGGGLAAPLPQAAPSAPRLSQQRIEPVSPTVPATAASSTASAALRPAPEPARPAPEPALPIPDRDMAAAAAGWAPPPRPAPSLSPSQGSVGLRPAANGPLPPFPPPSKQGMPGGPPPLQPHFNTGAPPFVGAGAPPFVGAGAPRPATPPQPAPWSDGPAPPQGQQRSQPGYDDAMARLDARRPQAPGGPPPAG